MSQDTADPTWTSDDGAAGGPGTPPASDVEASLELVRSSALQLLSGFSRAPSVLRIRAGGVTVEAEWPTDGAPLPAEPMMLLPAAADAPGGATPESPAQPVGVDVRSPAVGVLFHAPAPGAQPFVRVGDRVDFDQQIAIVEVMKLMIPVKAACAGTLSAVLKADGVPVEYDEPLFLISPAGT